jgi:predicted Fe-Mo cluster-binding NifX family protein
MRICIPVEKNNGLDSIVHGHFGSAPYFIVIDLATNQMEALNNINRHHIHGQCNPVGAISSQKINAVICKGMGSRAIKAINDSGIKVYRSIASKIEQIIAEFNSGALIELSVEEACRDHSCH